MRLEQEAKRHPFIREIMQIAKTWGKLAKTNKKYRRKKILDDALRRCDAFFSKSNDDTKPIADLGKQFIIGLKYTNDLLEDRDYVMGLLEQFSKLNWKQRDIWVTQAHREDLVKIEQVWNNFCEAVDQRLKHVEAFIDLTPILSAVDYLVDTESMFLSIFGDQYISSTITADHSCSICQKNPRVCNHVNGKFYDGVKCVTQLVNPTLVSVSLVSDPVDRRLRLWPWRMPWGGRPDLQR